MAKLAIKVHCFFTFEGLEKVELSDSSQFEFTFGANSNSKYVAIVEAWLESYLKGKPSKVLPPLVNTNHTPFTKLVFENLSNIPFGKVFTYEELAKKCGNQRAYRAIGTACGKNPWPLLIPCHRVIGKNGSFCGFSSGGIPVKEKLLSFEQTVRP